MLPFVFGSAFFDLCLQCLQVWTKKCKNANAGSLGFVCFRRMFVLPVCRSTTYFSDRDSSGAMKNIYYGMMTAHKFNDFLNSVHGRSCFWEHFMLNYEM
jgi:hypothetical protein